MANRTLNNGWELSWFAEDIRTCIGDFASVFEYFASEKVNFADSETHELIFLLKVQLREILRTLRGLPPPDFNLAACRPATIADGGMRPLPLESIVRGAIALSFSAHRLTLKMPLESLQIICNASTLLRALVNLFHGLRRSAGVEALALTVQWERHNEMVRVTLNMKTCDSFGSSSQRQRRHDMKTAGAYVHRACELFAGLGGSMSLLCWTPEQATSVIHLPG